MEKQIKSEAETLRQQAEELLSKKLAKPVNQLSEAETQKLIHELEVHQIELELQNQELVLAREQATIAADKYIDLYDFAPSGYFTLSRKGEIIQLNLLGAKMLGKERKLLKNSHFQLFISDESKPAFRLSLEKAFVSNTLETCDVALSVNGSSPIYVRLTGLVAKDGEHCLVTAVDITERVQAENALKESQEHFQLLFEKAPFGYQSLDFDGNFIEVNEKWLAMLGFNREEVIGKWFGDFLSAGYQDGFRKRFPIFKAQGHIHSEFEMVHKNGSVLFIAFDGRIGYESNGNFKQTHCILKDITEIKIAEEALYKSEAIQRKMVSNIGDVIVIIDQNGINRYKSPNITRLFGWDPEELVGKSTWDVVHPDDLEFAQQFVGKLATEPNATGTTEIRYRCKDGRYVWIKITLVNLLSDPDINGILGNYHDITERRLAEVILQESEERMRRAIVSSPVPIMIHDENDQVLQLSAGWTKFSGYIIEDIPTLADWTERAYGERSGFKKDYIDQLFLINHTVNNGEWIITAKDGSKRIWDFQTTPLGRIHGGKRVLHSMAIDVTEARQAEQELIIAKDHAEQSDRLKSAFLANMSHEIRTPMNGILGFANLLKEPGLTGEEQQEYIRIIDKSGVRMLNIINDIVDISKIEAGLMKVKLLDSNLNEKIEYLYNFFKPEAEAKGIHLSYRNGLMSKESIIKTDREKLYAILTNLVKNAIKFTHGGSIEFGYEIVEKIHEFSLLQFFVKDTGIGIPPDRQEAIFERFIQADIEDKHAYQGAGLGLSISKAYAEMLGGKIWVESEEGFGSTFYFSLPYTAVPIEKTAVQNAETSVAKGQKVRKLKILIAEDDEVSEMLVDIIVKLFGKEILKVRTGVEAVENCRENPDIDLILMDIQMPVLGGYESTRQIRKFNKEVIIIAQTAFGLTGDREKAIEAGCNDYISKPISKAELLALIQKYFGE